MSWSDLNLGVHSGLIEVRVTDEMVDEFIDAMEMSDPRYGRPDGVGRRLAPPYLVPKLGLDPLYIDYLHAHIGNGVFAKQRFRFYQPTWVGDVVKGEAKLVDKFEKRDKRFVTFEGEFRNAAGLLVADELRTIMVVSPTFRMKN
jgi:acyl dehydratase